MKLKRNFSFLCVSLFSIISTFAQENLHFHHYNTSNGLPTHTVDEIIKDSDGLIWFCAFYSKKLASFDSYRFNEFSFDKRVSLFFEDTIQGRKCLIISVDKVLHKFHLDEYSLAPFQTKNGNFIHVEKLIQDQNGIYRIASDKTLYSFDPNTNKTVGDTSFFDHNATTIFYHNKLLWIHEFGYIKSFDENNQLIKNYGKIRLPSSFFLTPDDKLGIFFGNQMLNIYNDKIDDFENFLVSGFFANEQLHNIIKANNNEYFIEGSFGIYKYNAKLFHGHLYTFENDNPFSLPSENVSTVHIDQDSILWVGLHQAGLAKCDLRGNDFTVMNKTKNGLKGDRIESFCIDNDGNYWIGASKKGVCRYIPDKDIYQHIPYFKSNEPGSWVTSFQMAEVQDENTIWFGSYGIGAHKVDITNIRNDFLPGNIQQKCSINGYFPSDGPPKQSISGWSLRNIYVDNDKTIWTGSFAGLSKYENNTWTSYFCSLNDNWKEKDLLCIEIFEDTLQLKDKLLIGTEEKGVYYLDKRTGNQGEVLFDHTPIKVEQIEKANGNNYWLMCNELYRASIDSNSMTGKIIDTIYLGRVETNKMAFDQMNRIWIATDQGLIYVNSDTKDVIQYTENDGLPSDILSWVYFDKNSKKMFACSNEGLIIFEPAHMRIDTKNPPIHFSRIKIFGKEITPGDSLNGRFLLTKNVNLLEDLTLKHTENDFSIEFAALAFNANHNIRYAYKLIGYEDNWRYCDFPSREASYSNLPHGHYTLMVSLLDKAGRPSDNYKSLPIIIFPAWYETWIFRILLLSIIGTFVFIIWKIRVRSMKKRQKELEKQVTERTAEIEAQKEELKSQADKLQENNIVLKNQKEEIESQSEELRATMEELHLVNTELEKSNSTKDKFFSIIAHDLKNPFHAISGFSSLLYKSFDVLDDDKKKEFISMIENSSKSASSLLENLLTWSRSQTNKIEFSPDIISIKKIVDDTFGLLEVNAEKKSIQLISKVKEDENAYADENMVTTVIRNLTSNALKFTKTNGSITIQTKQVGNDICISITDTGIGMKQEVIDNLFKIDQQNSTEGTLGEAGTGLGLIICKEFIDKNSGIIEVESSLGKGSTFTIFLPLSA